MESQVSTTTYLHAPRIPAQLVLQPLTEATGQLLEPVVAGADDWLVLDDEKSRGAKLHAELVVARKGASGLVVDTSRPPAVGGVHFLENCIPESKRVKPSKQEQVLIEKGLIQPKWRWEVGATDFTALLIDSKWRRDRLLCKGDSTRLHYEYLLLRFAAQAKRAEMVAKFKLSGEMPALPDDWIDHPDPDLRLSNYQKVGVMYALDQASANLFMDMGTGKTATAIQLMCLRARRKARARTSEQPPSLYKVLVVCPPAVCTNWKHELERFAVTPGKVATARGLITERIRAMAQAIRPEGDREWCVVIINYESLAATIDQICVVPWDLVITDESHNYKSAGAKRWGAMQKLRDATMTRLGMTGTPTGNSIMDLWTQLEFLEPGLSGFAAFKAFRKFHGTYISVDAGTTTVEKLVGLRNVPMLQERLTRTCYVITKQEAGLNLPPKWEDTVDVEMTELQAKYYARIRDELSLEHKDVLSGKVVSSMVIENVLTSLLRLAQVTSGHVTWDAIVDPDTMETVTPKRVEQISAINSKVEATVELLTDPDRDPLGKTVIWAIFNEDIRVLSKRLTELGIEHETYYGETSKADRELVVQRFNCDPSMRVLIASPKTGSAGLNLHGYDISDPENSKTNCDHMIYFSQGWSSIARDQSESRGNRRGSRARLRLTTLIVPGCIDEDIAARVQSMRAVSATVTDLREILQSVLGIG